MFKQLGLPVIGSASPSEPAKKVFDFGCIHKSDAPIERAVLPVGRIIVCSEDGAVLVRQVYDIEYNDFFVIEQEQGASWKSIGVEQKQIILIQKKIRELHENTDPGPAFLDRHLIALEYSLFLVKTITIMSRPENEKVDVRYLYATEQQKLIRAQVGKEKTWEALGVRDSGRAANKTVREECEKVHTEIEFRKMQSSLPLQSR